MLKGIDPCLDPDVLHALAAMGHGDLLLLVDTNFPAASLARGTVVGDALSVPNVTLDRAARAILSLMPLDTFVDDFAIRMEQDHDPETPSQPQKDVQREIDAAEGRARPMVSVPRPRYYELADGAFAIVRTGETRIYGCVAFRMGVIEPEDAP